MSSTPPPVTLSASMEAEAKEALAQAGFESPMAISPSPLMAARPKAVKKSSKAVQSQVGRKYIDQPNSALFGVAARELNVQISIEVDAEWDGESAGPGRLRWGKSEALVPKVKKDALKKDLRDSEDDRRRFADETPLEVVLANRVGHMPNIAVAVALGIDGKDRPFTYALIDTVMLLASSVVQDLKDQLSVPRPTDQATWGKAAVTMPRVPMPKFTAYPGGHAFQLEALRGVLRDVAGQGGALNLSALDAIVNRLIEHRRLAGLHTATDNRVGRELGAWLAAEMLKPERAATCPRWQAVLELARSEWPQGSSSSK